MIYGLLYVGFVVESVDTTRRTFKRLFGLAGEAMAPDSFLGTDKGARLAFPNECWLYIMESQQPDSGLRAGAMQHNTTLPPFFQDPVSTIDHGLRIRMLKFAGNLIQGLSPGAGRPFLQQCEQPRAHRVQLNKADFVFVIPVDQQVGGLLRRGFG